jgi:hypothetical protein
MRRDTHRVGVGDRGQSVFDFSIGVSLFLIVVLGVLVFVPTAFPSFTADAGGGAGDGLAADRAATYLTESALGSDRASAGFDTDCTLLFFTGSTDHPDIAVEPGDCGLERAVPLASNASVEPDQLTVNVTIERRKPDDPGRQRLCWNADAGLTGDRLVPTGDSDCAPSSSDDIDLTAGPSAKNNQNYAIAERYGYFVEEGVYLVVRAW